MTHDTPREFVSVPREAMLKLIETARRPEVIPNVLGNSTHGYHCGFLSGKQDTLSWLKLQIEALPSSAAPVAGEDARATVEDYENCLREHRERVRQLDVALNGDDAASGPSLCDVLGQLKDIVRRTGKPILAAHPSIVPSREKGLEEALHIVERSLPPKSDPSGEAAVLRYELNGIVSELKEVLAQPAAVEAKAVGWWQCKDCGCKTYARVDEAYLGDRGRVSYRPGPDVCCVSCKRHSPWPDAPTPQPPTIDSKGDSTMNIHKSDCALHNMSAELPGPCDCGSDKTPRERAASFLDAIEPLNKAQRIDALAGIFGKGA